MVPYKFATKVNQSETTLKYSDPLRTHKYHTLFTHLALFSEKENDFDIIALNETLLTKKINFQIHGYDTIKSDHSTGLGGGVAFLVKHGLVVSKEYRNTDFNIITDNEALVIDIDLSDNQNLILATIYCPNGNPNFRLFETIKNLSNNVMFVGDFNSKLQAFGCAKKNTSGPMLKNIQNQLNLIYLKSDEHTHMDRYTGT